MIKPLPFLASNNTCLNAQGLEGQDGSLSAQVNFA